MTKPRYWTQKHVARTNMEVVRTIANVVQVVLSILILAKVMGWL